MKVNAPRLLTAFYATLTVGLIGFSLLAYIHPLGQVWGTPAILCFLLIILAYILDMVTDRWRKR